MQCALSGKIITKLMVIVIVQKNYSYKSIINPEKCVNRRTWIYTKENYLESNTKSRNPDKANLSGSYAFGLTPTNP